MRALLLVGVPDPLPFFRGAPTEEAELEEAEPEEVSTATALGEDGPLLIARSDGAGEGCIAGSEGAEAAIASP